MTEPITVSIEATKRLRIIKAVLTESWPYDLRDESATKLEISDNEVRHFLDTIDVAEYRKIVDGPHGQKFLDNSNAALARLHALKPKRQANGRVASRFVDFAPEEVSQDNRPLKFAGDK